MKTILPTATASTVSPSPSRTVVAPADACRTMSANVSNMKAAVPHVVSSVEPAATLPAARLAKPVTTKSANQVAKRAAPASPVAARDKGTSINYPYVVILC